MDMTISCPACGALLTVSNRTGEITCTYCGNHFHIDQSQANPALHLEQPEEMNPNQMGTPEEMGMVPPDIPFQSAETESREQPEYAPQPERYTPAPTPRPVMPPPTYQEPPQRSNKIWVTVAVVVGLILFAICGCMMVAAYFFQNSFR